jgi:hypothetical protein
VFIVTSLLLNQPPAHGRGAQQTLAIFGP